MIRREVVTTWHSESLTTCDLSSDLVSEQVGFTSIRPVVKCHIVASCLCLLHVRSKGSKVMVDCQDSNLCNSGKLMVKILNMVMVVTTWRMGVTPPPSPLS